MPKTFIHWCVATSLLSAAVAMGQTPAPTTPPPDAPVVTPVTPTEPPEPKPEVGFRVGGSVGLGTFIPGPQLNFYLFDLHAGVQVNPLFGAYVRFGRTAGIGLSATAGPTGGSLGISASGFWLIGANAELGLGDSFFIAAGPQVGIGGWAAARMVASTSGQAELGAVATEGPQPGLDFKIGFGFGGGGSRVKQIRRKQVTLALDVSLLYATRVVDASVSGGTGGAAVSVSFADALSIAPTLHLGYEFR